MNIAIIGAGNVGRALGQNFSKQGHKIFFGVPDPQNESYAEIKKNPAFSFQSTKEATAQADLVFLAVPWSAASDAVKEISASEKKILVDCTNPIKPGLAGFFHDDGKSGAEQIQALVPNAKVVKCFNQTGAENMGDPNQYKPKPVMFAASDNNEAKAQVLKLANESGFTGYDAGPLSAAMYLENLAFLWIHLAYRAGLGRTFAFSVQKN